MKKYDVVIIGGGTSGCSCAWNCAKLGLKVLLIEKSIQLGGTITSGLVIPVMKSGDNLINTDFYNFIISEMKKYNAQITYQSNPGWFNPEIMKIVLDKVLIDAGVDILFNTAVNFVDFSRPIVNYLVLDNTILSSCINSLYSDNNSSVGRKILSECIEAKYFVDATGNANFCQKINCKFLEDSNEYQPMSLRFIMSGINLNKFGGFITRIDTDRNVTSVEEIDGEVHLSTAFTWDTNKHWALAPLFDEAVKQNDLKTSDCNYFQVFTIAGMPNSIAFNCPRIVKKYNPNSNYDTSKALIEARAAIYRIAEFCKKYFAGFENAYISNIADMMGVRVSNRVRGKYVYTIDDIRNAKEFKNPALFSNYPIDVHSGKKNSSILENNKQYQLPIESLMSADYDNVYMIGRCISADYQSQGALRVQASCFSMGEAVAKDIYIKLKN